MGRQLVKEEAEPRVRIYHTGDWSAVYVDEHLVHWHDTPSLGEVLAYAGVAAIETTLPDWMAKEIDECNNGEAFSMMPDAHSEFLEKCRQHDASELDAEILKAAERLEELKKKRIAQT